MPTSTLGKSLSDPDVPAGNNGFDNANCDLIMHVNDVLLGAESNRYDSQPRIARLMRRTTRCTCMSALGLAEAYGSLCAVTLS